MVGRRRPRARRMGAREDQRHDERAARGTRRGAGAAPGVTPSWWRQESPIGTLTVLATDRGVQQIELGPTAFDVDAVEGCDDEVALELDRSEEHTSELQSRLHLVCRLLLAKK